MRGEERTTAEMSETGDSRWMIGGGRGTKMSIWNDEAAAGRSWDILGTAAMKRLSDEERGTHSTAEMGGTQQSLGGRRWQEELR